MTNNDLHPLTKKIMHYLCNAHPGDCFYQSKLEKLIIEYLEEVSERIISEYNLALRRDLLAENVKRILSLPEKKTLQDELAKVFQESHVYIRNENGEYNSYLSGVNVHDIAKTALQFLKDKGALKE